MATTPRPTDEIGRRRDRREALAWVTTAWRSEQLLRALEDAPAVSPDVEDESTVA
jgi:hypothetical protein